MLENIIDKKGYTRKSSRSGTRAMPELAMSRDCLRLLKSFLEEFGLTPSSRSRISLPPPETDDPLEKYFREITDR